MEPEHHTLPEHLCTTPVFGGVRVAWSLVFYVMFCRSLFVLFLLAIVLSVLLWFMDSDYPSSRIVNFISMFFIFIWWLWIHVFITEAYPQIYERHSNILVDVHIMYHCCKTVFIKIRYIFLLLFCSLRYTYI